MARSIKKVLKGDKTFYWALTALVAMFILTVLSDYDTCWMHPDALFKDIPKIFKHGNEFGLQDFKLSFEDVLSSGEGRVRYFTSLLSRFDLKVRGWMWQHFVPHPSFGISIWLVSLILTPIVFAKFLRNMGVNSAAIWNSILLYMMSMGFFSGLTMFFNRAKPFVNFLTIFCLYLSSEIRVGLAKKTGPSIGFLVIGLFLSVLVAFTTDEYGWFIYLAIPVLFFGVDQSWFKKRNWRFVLLYLVPPLSLFLLITFVIPFFARYWGFEDFSIWSKMFKRTDGASVWNKFEFKNILINFRNLWASQVITHKWGSESFHEPIKAFALFGAYLMFLFRNAPKKERVFYRNVFFASLLVVIFITIISLGHNVVVAQSFYYGSNFSLYYALLVGGLLSIGSPGFRVLNKLILVSLIIISGQNAITESKKWRNDHVYWYRDSSPDEARQMTGSDQKKPLFTYQEAKQIWQNRNDAETLLKIKPATNIMGYWVFRELENFTSPIISNSPEDKLSSDKKLHIKAVAADSSYFPNTLASNVVDNRSQTYWQAQCRFPCTPWIMFDLGESKKVSMLRILPYQDMMWTGTNAFWQVSQDGKTWISVARLQANDFKIGQWLSYKFPEIKPFRYYRLRLDRNYAGFSETQLF